MTTTRDFTVATFVVYERRVLLLYHSKLQKWLPPGGHIDPHELPDDAACREVLEETGIHVELVGERALDIENPRQLIIPQGIQLEEISPGHEHIDLVYFARPVGSTELRGNQESMAIGWYAQDELVSLAVTDEIRRWVGLAVAGVPAVSE